MHIFPFRTIILSFFIFIWSTTISFAADQTDQNPERWKEIYDLINQYHVKAISPEKLTEGSIHGLIDALDDPFTDYFTDQEYESFMNSLEGNYTGIGMVVGEKDGKIFIHEVFEGSPAEQAGIQEGDELVGVDELEWKAPSIEEVVSMVKGEEGTKVKLKINRTGKVLSLEIMRKKIEMPVVDAEMMDGNIGYLQLTTFSYDSINKFSDELKELQKKNIQGLIIDLRDNPGGLLRSALTMSSLFLEDGPVVHVKDRAGQEETYEVKRGNEWNLPLVILVNDHSASASEIVTSALKDYEKATIIGTRTYGKGTVQELIPLDHGGVLKLTVEEYFSPKHNTINQIGIEPHILVNDQREQLQAALYVLHNNNQMTLKANGDSAINGKKEESVTPAIRKNGSWYLGVRSLAYVFHGKVGFDEKKREAQLTLGKQTHVFTLSGRNVRVENGTMYVSLDQILTQYPDVLKSTGSHGEIILSENK